MLSMPNVASYAIDTPMPSMNFVPVELFSLSPTHQDGKSEEET